MTSLYSLVRLFFAAHDPCTGDDRRSLFLSATASLLQFEPANLYAELFAQNSDE